MELIEIMSLMIISSILIGFVINRLLSKKLAFEISLFQSYISGLIIIYFLVLAGIPLNYLITGLFYFSLAASAYFIFYVFKKRKIKILPARLFIFLVFTLIAVYVSQDLLNNIIYQPISAWDARSIWYFKAKQMFFANGLHENTGINHHTVMGFSHPEYPLLVPALGAMLAKYVGYWNEFLPKSNLILLWIGIVFAFISLKHMHLIAKIVMFISLLIISPFNLSIGYMDAWLGIYASLSILFFMEYTRLFNTRYLMSGLCCLIFCNYLKQDASLITISILGSYIVLIFTTRNKRFINYTARKAVKIIPLIMILLIPFLLWTYYKIKWNLASHDFDFGKLFWFSSYDIIFSTSKLNLIYRNIIEPVHFISIVFITGVVSSAAIAYARFSGFAKPVIKNGIINSLLPIFSAVLFAAGLHILYCLSSHELAWHLSTSADRLRLDLLFIALPALYGTTGLLFYFPQKMSMQNKSMEKDQKKVKKVKIKKAV